MRTRAQPKPYTGGRVFHVYPPGHQGQKSEPSFDALMCAYNYYCGGGDTVTAGRPRVKPGDTILVHGGLYRYHPEYYTGDRTINARTPFEGTYYLTANGTADKPIAIKAAGDKAAGVVIPDDLNVIATYPIAVPKGAKNAAAANAFVAFVTGAQGQTILAKYGVPVDGTV